MICGFFQQKIAGISGYRDFYMQLDHFPNDCREFQKGLYNFDGENNLRAGIRVEKVSLSERNFQETSRFVQTRRSI